MVALVMPKKRNRANANTPALAAEETVKTVEERCSAGYCSDKYRLPWWPLYRCAECGFWMDTDSKSYNGVVSKEGEIWMP